MALHTHLDAQLPANRTAAPEQMSFPDMESDATLSPGEAAADTATAPVWLQRISLFILVLFCVYLGVLVLILPWWKRVWDDNLWMQSHPALAAILHTGAVRGMISGLGLLDIWIGISEAVHYREHRG